MRDLCRRCINNPCARMLTNGTFFAIINWQSLVYLMTKADYSGPVIVQVVDLDNNLVEAIFVPGVESVPLVADFLEGLFEPSDQI